MNYKIIKMTAVSNKGTIWYSEDKKRWFAQYIFTDGKRSYGSPYRYDCELWLKEIRGKGSAAASRRIDLERAVRDIEMLGGLNPVQVPGFPQYFFTENDLLFSAKRNRIIQLKMTHINAFTMCSGGKYLTATINKLKYCIKCNISPLLLSHCKLSVIRGEDGLALADITDVVHKTTRRNKHRHVSQFGESYIRCTEEWCHYLLEVWAGKKESIVNLRNILETLRPELERYIRNTLRQTSENKVKYLVEETEGETLSRAITRTAAICNPYRYEQHYCRILHYNIAKRKGKVIKRDGKWRIESLYVQ